MAKGMTMEEFRAGLASEATEENKKLKEEISSLKKTIGKKNKDINDLRGEIKNLKDATRALGNRCFAQTHGLMCVFCGLQEYCPHKITEEEQQAIYKYMKENNLPYDDDSRIKVSEFLAKRRLADAEKAFKERNKDIKEE